MAETCVDVVVDVRETSIFAILQSCYESENDMIHITKESLDVGDVHIRFGSTRIIIERKTCADMAASVKDGRWREQKVRILSSTIPRHIIYIIEGAPTQNTMLVSDFPIHGMKPSVLSGMMIYTMLRDGIHVVNVPNTTETAAWIWAIALKCLSNPEKITRDNTTTEPDYLQHVKIKKKDNTTPNSCYILQLCQIPNISRSTAVEIAKKYPTMLGLLKSLSELPDNESRVRCLTEIQMIGKKKAIVLLEYLLPL